MNAKLGIHDCHRVGPHLAGPDRMVGDSDDKSHEPFSE
jgi:hypothetical protein